MENKQTGKQKIDRKRIAILSSLLIVVLVGSGFLITYINDISSKKIRNQAVKTEEIPGNLKLETETKEAKLFQTNITIPVTEIAAIDQPIQDWANKQDVIFMEKVHQEHSFFNQSIFQHTITTKVKKVKNDIHTFKLKSKQIYNEDNSRNQTIQFIVDSNNKQIITLTKLLDKEKEAQFQEVLTDYTDDTISLTDKVKFELTDEYVAFFINKKKVIIPHESLNDIFTESYKDKFYVAKEIEETPENPDSNEANETELEKPVMKEKVIALTFDDGPHQDFTPRILDALDEYDAKATFFMLSKNVRNYPEIAQSVADAGHEIANHSDSHPNLLQSSADQLNYEIIESKKIIEEVTGIKPTLFRPPYGNYNEYVANVVAESDQKIILWSLDTLDWQHRNANQVVSTSLNFATAGSIILMHDIHGSTADAIPQLLKSLADEGYKFVTVSEILQAMEVNGVGPHYGLSKQ